MFAYPVAVCLYGEIKCIPHIESDELFSPGYLYIGLDDYSGYEIYANINDGKFYAADMFK